MRDLPNGIDRHWRKPLNAAHKGSLGDAVQNVAGEGRFDSADAIRQLLLVTMHIRFGTNRH
jgi:hypothetical protein